MGYIILVLFYLLCPLLIIYLIGRYKFLERVGSVVLCYVTGLILGNSGILSLLKPDAGELGQVAAGVASIADNPAYKIQDTINTVTILLAIPLLLFSLDIKSWLKMAGKTFLSLILGLASALFTIFLGFYLFRGLIPEIWKISGMLIGVYSGGTPNLAALRIALNVDPDTYIVTHTYDLVVGAFVLLFLLTVAQKFFLLYMRPFKISDKESTETSSSNYSDQFESYEGILTRKQFLPILVAIGLAIGIVGLSYLISSSVVWLMLTTGLSEHKESSMMTYIILSITTLGILASLVPRINRIQKTFQAGMYLILIFCLVVASMADIRSFNLESWPILVYIILCVPGALLVHSLLSKIFKVDVDNFLIISVALSMSPPFVPPMAAALKNKYIIIPGLVIGIIGYALGNYLGVLVAMILK
jgi:uncharacterized membrane protein